MAPMPMTSHRGKIPWFRHCRRSGFGTGSLLLLCLAT